MFSPSPKYAVPIRSGRLMRGITLLELMMAVAVVSLLFGIGTPAYRQIVERQKIGQCVRDLIQIVGQLERYRTLHFALPDTLDELRDVPRVDPWGFDYRFLNFEADIAGIKGKIRKDHNLHPLNSEFDLYSVGPDGASNAPLTARASRDDIIWARDGGFIGKAEDF
jgi:general secretion pathway protein G